MHTSKTGFTAYGSIILMNIAVFAVASLIFAVGFNDFSPIPVFIGFCLIQTTGILLFALLPRKAKPVPRHVSKILIGSTLLILAGILDRQNFQIEGFFYLVLAGFAGGAVIHFGMKVLGTVFTGRVWCSWGCWTAALLDFLPYKTSTSWANGRMKYLRYIHFIISLIAVAFVFFILKHSMQSINSNPEQNWTDSINAVYWMAGGNLLYYFSGITLAVLFKDNRAFCKYLCPVSVLLKGAGLFSLTRIKPVRKSCSACKKCESVCPASIAVHSYVTQGLRIASTECLMCLNCVASCPEGNLKTSVGFDISRKELLNKK
jgi:ferredoxin-type protein NapH